MAGLRSCPSTISRLVEPDDEEEDREQAVRRPLRDGEGQGAARRGRPSAAQRDVRLPPRGVRPRQREDGAGEQEAWRRCSPHGGYRRSCDARPASVGPARRRDVRRLRLDGGGGRCGGFVQHSNNIYRITEVLDFNSVIAKEVETGRSTSLRINELSPVVPDGALATEDIDEIADEDWKVAQHRYSAIKPLLTMAVMGRQDVEERAKEVGSDTATLYRWLQKYKAIGVVTALIPQKRGWKEGKSRIPVFAEQVIDEVIKDF